ncbi:MAG: DUF188 domain-containing protein, partial [Myxococcales bacterium]|nr:DUF188 domain-containing protein [Myxococcales bacterium]
LEVGARALGTNGKPFNEDSIGGALAIRQLKSELREMGLDSTGPQALSQRDRSRFSEGLDQIVQAALRA